MYELPPLVVCTKHEEDMEVTLQDNVFTHYACPQGRCQAKVKIARLQPKKR